MDEPSKMGLPGHKKVDSCSLTIYVTHTRQTLHSGGARGGGMGPKPLTMKKNYRVPNG